ncbi:MAG: motility associated factor glycosyltransferase family protein [Deltaproteobacteria bacterium]|nr:motility associated factor glycosyltransferase family protein [Deltaproteobacteria bacterium]
MTVVNFFEKNLQALEKHQPHVARWLKDQRIDRELRLITNRWRSPDWPLASGKGLFEAIPPRVIYESWVPKEKAHLSATIIVGCNLGYGLNHVLTRTPNAHKVFVVEPRAEMMAACLGQNDYSQVFKINRLFFLPPDLGYLRKAVFQQLCLQHEFGDIFLRQDIPSQQIGPEYMFWAQRCTEVLTDLRVEMNTLRESQDTMVKNELDNFQRAMKDGSISYLKNKAEGLSAVILAAGPSLNTHARLMLKHPATALYASAFQLLPALQRYRLKPHLCMAIDFTDALRRVYDRLDKNWARSIPLVYSCKVTPGVVQAYPGPTLPVWTTGGLGTAIWRGKEPVLNSGRNVGIALIRFLNWCGVKRLFLVGFDFAWQGEFTHVKGHLASESRFHFDPKRHLKLKNKKGETVFSNPTFITALRTVEAELKNIRAEVFNIYGGYATIAGAPEITWEEAVSSGLLNSDSDRLKHFSMKLSERQPSTPPLLEAKSSQWTESLGFARKRLEKLFRRAKNNQKEIKASLDQLLIFLTQDPLYHPYLVAEIRRLAGLIFTGNGYGAKDLSECNDIIQRALDKVREMDQKLEARPTSLRGLKTAF